MDDIAALVSTIAGDIVSRFQKVSGVGYTRTSFLEMAHMFVM